MIILLTWVVILIVVIVIYLRRDYSRFDSCGVKYFKPYPVFGNSTRVMLRLDHVTDDMLNTYNTFRDERFVVKFELGKEIIMIRDLEVLKQITIKDFDYFHDHRSHFDESDFYFTRNLFSLKGKDWKEMRSALSPAFTSSKIRAMVPFMVEIGKQMSAMLKKEIEESKTGYVEMDCKDLMSRYASDIIASCAFGLKVDSHTDPENQFFIRGKDFTDLSYRQMVNFTIMVKLPRLAKYLKLDYPPTPTKNFFISLVLDTMKKRESENIFRPDMIHLLMEAKKGKLTHEPTNPNDVAAGFATAEESTINTIGSKRVWSDRDLVSQAMLFFVAGFETVSIAMSFLLYELAVNPDIQDRLAKEIKDHNVKNGGEFDFNSIQNMTYLDMVVSELLRLWPPAVVLDRECTKDYNLGRANKNSKKDFIIRKGTGVQVPAFAFHHDPQYFPNPKKFDPERFSDENKHKIHPFAYMPFGIGPRNCIGSRFALCEVKVMTYVTMLHLEVLPTATTKIPAKLSTDEFHFRLAGGHGLRFRLRA